MMDVAYYQDVAHRKEEAVLVVPFWENEHGDPIWAFSIPELEKVTHEPFETKDFKGKKGELTQLYIRDFLEKRCLFLGLGKEEKCSLEILRQCVSKSIRYCIDKKLTSCNILLPTIAQLSNKDICAAVVESVAMTRYSFSMKTYDTAKDRPSTINFLGVIGSVNQGQEICNQALQVSSSVNFARDLVNGNACDINPQVLAQKAIDIGATHVNVETKILSRAEIEQEGMGLFLAVAKGSEIDPAFIIVKYQGNPGSKDHTILVGKGVTFDTGGLNLKPTGSMETMKCDMSGAAAVLGAVSAASALGLKVNVTAVVAATDNAIDAKSYRPGDVFTSFLGKTVEIGNTDAEGRLTLADAIAYAEKYLAPTRIIDLATLTGAIEVALGNERSGLFSNDTKLIQQIEKAAEKSGEKVWNFPMDAEYKEYFKSDIADMKNSSKRKGGSITAALFLQEFVQKTPWAHLDIAGTAYLEPPKNYHRTPATGVGVRMLVELLRDLEKGN